jgi:hypothetical protein
MSNPRNPTVHVPAADEYDPVFHSSTRCPGYPVVSEAVPRSKARRDGLTECARCFERRMRTAEHGGPGRVGPVPRIRPPPSDATTSGFSDFLVE